MKYYSTSIYIEASQETTWIFLTDIHRRPEWETGVQTILFVDDRPIGLETSFKERLRIFGPFHAEGEWHIAQFKPPAVYEHRGKLPITGVTTFRYMLEPSEDGCLCTVQVYYEPRKGLVGNILDSALVGPRISRSISRNLRRMKKLVETRPSEG